MRKLLVQLFILMAAVTACFSQPALEIVGGDTYEWPFSYPPDSPLLAKIVLKNSGNQSLHFEYIKPSCSCTSAPLEKSSLEPGETMVMNVKVETKGFNGKVTKTMDIRTNDPVQPVRTLTLLFEVRYPIELLPKGFFAFRKLTVDSLSRSELKLKNSSEQTITFTDFTTEPADVKFNLQGKKVLKPGQEIDIWLDAKPTKEGPYSCSVKMKTDFPDIKEVVIYGSGKANPPGK